jgi:hypothetical protein
MDDTPSFLRRKEAGQYLKSKYGFSSDKSLGKLATVGSGPEFRKVGQGRTSPVVYEREKLDEWVLAKLSAPLQSTSDLPADSRGQSPGRPRRSRN